MSALDAINKQQKEAKANAERRGGTWYDPELRKVVYRETGREVAPEDAEGKTEDRIYGSGKGTMGR